MPLQRCPLTLIVATTPVPIRQSSVTTANDSNLDIPVKLGIGQNGTLPWPRIKADLSFFARITTRPPRPGTTNAVIMGRKTYFSIPEGLRPLKNRINVVLSRDTGGGKVSQIISDELQKRRRKESRDISDGTGSRPVGAIVEGEKDRDKDKGEKRKPQDQTLSVTTTPVNSEAQLSSARPSSSSFSANGGQSREPLADAIVSSGIDSALTTLDNTYGVQSLLGNVFVIGGAEIYASALQMTGRTVRIVMTSVKRKSVSHNRDVGFDCDTFFPLDSFDSQNGWRAVSVEEVSTWVGERVTGEWKDEGEVMIQITGYERTI